MPVLLTTLQVLFVIVALVGIGLWSVPLALLVGGVVGAVACELAESRRRARPASTRPDEVPR